MKKNKIFGIISNLYNSAWKFSRMIKLSLREAKQTALGT